MDKSDAQLTADNAEFKRVQDLVASKAIAARLLDEARKKYEASQAGKKAAQAALKSAKANVSVSTAKLAVADADRKAAQAQIEVSEKELEEMDVMMEYATLKAPFDGVVTQRNVDPGDLVRNIQTASNAQRHPLFAIAQIERVRVRVVVPENEAAECNAGDAVSLVLRSMPRPIPGQVSRVARSLDKSTRTMLVEVDLPNSDQWMLPGMYGEATITLEEKSDALVLPASAIRYDGSGGSYVYVVDANDVVSIVDVTS